MEFGFFVNVIGRGGEMAIGDSFILHDTSPVELAPVQGTAFVLVWARWSQQSREFKSIFERVSSEHHDGVRFATRICEDLTMAIPRPDLSVLPVVLFFHDGVLVDRLLGLQAESKLRDWTDQCCKGSA